MYSISTTAKSATREKMALPYTVWAAPHAQGNVGVAEEDGVLPGHGDGHRPGLLGQAQGLHRVHGLA